MANTTIVWRGTNGNNINLGRAGQEIIAICNHIMQGAMASTDNWFKNSASGASAHYGIPKNGKVIYQWVADSNRAWANGVVNESVHTPAWVNQAVKDGVNPNDLTVSIEHEGFTGQDMPEAQYQATLWLHRYLLDKHPTIKLSREYIIGHYQIDFVNREFCPGAGFPWDRLITDLLAGSGGTVPPTFNPNPKGLNVGPGMLAKLSEIRETAHTNEQYFAPNPGQPLGLSQRSMLWTDQGSMLLAIQDLQPDGVTPAPTWTVQQYRKI